MHGLDGEREMIYPDFVLSALNQAARAARGEATGQAKLLLKLLQLKGFTPTDAERERILGCTDEATLETWAARILVARTLHDAFAD